MYRSSTSSGLAKALVCLASQIEPAPSTRPSTVQRRHAYRSASEAPTSATHSIAGKPLEPLTVEAFGPAAEHDGEVGGQVRWLTLATLFEPQLMDPLSIAGKENIGVAAADAAAPFGFICRRKSEVLKLWPLGHFRRDERLWRRIGQRDFILLVRRVPV
jgi:hypothetical protein